MIIVYEEEIIEVSADLLGRGHGCINVKFFPVREGGEEMGQLARIQNAGIPLSGTFSEIEDCIRVLKTAEEKKAFAPGGEITDEELRELFSKK